MSRSSKSIAIAAAAVLTGASAVLLADDRFANDSQQILEGLTRGPVPDENQLFRAKGASAPLNSVNLRIKFDHGSARLKPVSLGLLDELATALKNEKIRQRRVALIGHTDSTGSEAFNLTLSKQRAKAVKEHLVRHLGLATERFELSGLGESAPLNNNATPIQQEVNRRVEISLLP
ncbi:MAG: OmpA family protein [Granulosicoccus sp.]